MSRINFSTLVSVLGASSSFAALSASATPKSIPKLVPFSVEQIYVPFGFDDNDNSEVIVHGNLPSTCYKFQEFRPQIDSETKVVSIAAYVLQYPNSNCLQMLIPFTAPVKLGVLKQGDYKVQVNNSPGAQSKVLNISASKTESADDFLYAPVESVELAALPQESAEGTYQVTIQGKFPRMFVGCMIMKDVRAQLQGNNMIVVQPIAETVDDERCNNQKPDLTYTSVAKIKGTIPADVLVHVRSLNGQSVNKQYDIIPESN